MSLATITGYKANERTPYSPEQRFPPGSLTSRVFVVTGGHGGIGYETTRFLVRAGARVIIASRTESKVTEAIDKLSQDHDPTMRERLSFVKLDLNSLRQVEYCANEVLDKEQRLDGIVCNAGIMAWPHELTEVINYQSLALASTSSLFLSLQDGIEQQFQVHTHSPELVRTVEGLNDILKQVNHLGHFLLVTRLLPLLEKTYDVSVDSTRIEKERD